MNIKAFNLNNRNQLELNVIITEDENEEYITMICELNDKKIIVSDESHFSTLQKLRTELISMNFDLKCNGALVNVYPSPMMRYTSKAYFLTLGEQAKNDTIVNIYDYADISESINVEQQNLFYKKWIKS